MAQGRWDSFFCHKNERGVSLVEVTVVAGVLALIVSATAGSFTDFIRKQRQIDVRALLRSTSDEMRLTLTLSGSWLNSVNQGLFGADGSNQNGRIPCVVGAGTNCGNFVVYLSSVRDHSAAPGVELLRLGVPAGANATRGFTFSPGRQACNTFNPNAANGDPNCPLQHRIALTVTCPAAGNCTSPQVSANGTFLLSPGTTPVARERWGQINMVSTNNPLNYNIPITPSALSLQGICTFFGGAYNFPPNESCNINPVINAAACASLQGVFSPNPSPGTCNISAPTIFDSCNALGGTPNPNNRATASSCVLGTNNGTCPPGQFLIRSPGNNQFTCVDRFIGTQTQGNRGNGNGTCAQGGAVIAFSGTQPVCDNPYSTVDRCGAGTVMDGLNTNGTPHCVNLPAPPTPPTVPQLGTQCSPPNVLVGYHADGSPDCQMNALGCHYVYREFNGNGINDVSCSDDGLGSEYLAISGGTECVPAAITFGNEPRLVRNVPNVPGGWHGDCQGNVQRMKMHVICCKGFANL